MKNSLQPFPSDTHWDKGLQLQLKQEGEAWISLLKSKSPKEISALRQASMGKKKKIKTAETYQVLLEAMEK